MNSLKEWAAFYIDKKIWVFPYMSEKVPWKFWKDKKDADYINLSSTWTWNGDIGLELIVGKKGIRIIEVTTTEQLERALNLLELPEDYPWIIDRRKRLAIIVDTPNVSKRTFGMPNKEFKNFLLLWQGYYVLPTTGIPYYFYKNRVPIEHPIQVPDDIFLDCFDTLIKEFE